MAGKRGNLYVLFTLVLIFSVGFVGAITGEVITGEIITGEATHEDVAASVTVVGSLVITVFSPENRTYIFGPEDTEYPIELNVSSDSEVDTWWYTLEDLDSHIFLNGSTVFTPNGTIYAALGSNRITVYANNSDGVQSATSTIFAVRASNNHPEFGEIANEVFVCEGDSLFYTINATDYDSDDLTLDINPKNPFFIFPTSFSNINFIESFIFSATLGKNEVGFYEEMLSITDNDAVDNAYVNISVIEINNPPVLTPVGAQTVWSKGDGSLFYKQARATDTEDGNQNAGNLDFDLTFNDGVTPFFTVGSTGFMIFTANDSFLGENNQSVVYNLTLCVSDNGLEDVHENISICEQDGGSTSRCNNFSLTVTGENRAPNITSYSPSGLQLAANSSDTLTFSVTKRDSDGTVPDSSWYVNDALNAFYSGQNQDYFSYSFGCGVSGVHEIRAVISDGELTDSLTWNISLTSVDCQVFSSGESGEGGGGGGSSCDARWACEDWLDCDNAASALTRGILAGEDYRLIQQNCDLYGWDESICGFQKRVCSDFANCGYTLPTDLQVCYYSENPSCSDGIKNCHDGACEFLVDCGGPCGACATCSDGIQNQGEDDVDCGGSCPLVCTRLSPEEGSFLKSILNKSLGGKSNYLWILVVLLTILVVKVVQIYKHHHAFKSVKSYEIISSVESELR